MKKIIIIAVAALCASFTLAAQDMTQATETAKAANEALMNGDNETALNAFQEALSMAELCGEDGFDLVETCKGIIPKIILSIAKNNIKAGEFDIAIENLNKAAAVAKEYMNTDVAKDAEALIPQVYNNKASKLFNDKDFAGAIEAYKVVLENNPNNGIAALKMGQAQMALGQNDEAIASLEQAAANGQEKNANKLISTYYLKGAQTALKAGNGAEALDLAKKSNEYVESANAYKISGLAAKKLGKNSEIIENFKKYIELSPNAADAPDFILTIAATAQKAGDKATAKEFYEKLVANAKYGETAKAQLKTL